MQAKLQVLENEIATVSQDGIEYICITDIARYKNPDRTDGSDSQLPAQPQHQRVSWDLRAAQQSGF